MEGESQFRQININRGQAVIFSSSFCHARGLNGTIDDQDYVYHLFAYIVSEEVDYPVEVATRVLFSQFLFNNYM
jgi:hypothetical protein